MVYDPELPGRARTPFGDFELHPTHLQTRPIRYVSVAVVSEQDRRAAAVTVIDRLLAGADVLDEPGQAQAREILGMLGLWSLT